MNSIAISCHSVYLKGIITAVHQKEFLMLQIIFVQMAQTLSIDFVLYTRNILELVLDY